MNEKQKAYEDQIEAQLREWSAKIEGLKAKAQKAEAEARVRYHRQVEELESREKVARAKLAELKNAGADAWEKFKGGVEDAVSAFRQGVERE